MKEISRSKVFSSFFWRFLERLGAQGVSSIVALLLARLLTPEDYGTVALVSVFTIILNVFVESGLGNALIQKKDADNVDFSSVFYFNVALGILLYIICFFCAAPIAKFYNRRELVPLIRVLGLTVIIAAVKNVEQAYVSKHMLFKKFFFSTLGGTIGAAVVGLSLAFAGYGPWALVAQQVFNSFVDTLILWFTVKWRPSQVFSMKRLKKLIFYGWKLTVSCLIENVYNNIRQLIIGRSYSPTELAFYNQGRRLPYFFSTTINNSIDAVLLPTMSNVQDDRLRVKEITRRAIRTSIYLIAPIMLGIVAIATPLVKILLTEKWLNSVFYLRIFCVTAIFLPVHSANLNAISAMGRSDVFLKLEIIKKTVGVIAILATMSISVRAMAYSLLITSFLNQIINSFPNKKLLSYGYVQQIRDFLPGLLLALFMAVVVYSIQFIGLSDIITLLIQIPLGALIYIGGSKLLHIDSFDYLVSVCRQFLSIKKKQTNSN